MYHIQKLKRNNNSLYITIPADIVKALILSEGEHVIISLDKHTINISKHETYFRKIRETDPFTQQKRS